MPFSVFLRALRDSVLKAVALAVADAVAVAVAVAVGKDADGH
jgi:hypothetical protein